jgi:hypothetical protein
MSNWACGLSAWKVKQDHEKSVLKLKEYAPYVYKKSMLHMSEPAACYLSVCNVTWEHETSVFNLHEYVLLSTRLKDHISLLYAMLQGDMINLSIKLQEYLHNSSVYKVTRVHDPSTWSKEQVICLYQGHVIYLPTRLLENEIVREQKCMWFIVCKVLVD